MGIFRKLFHSEAGIVQMYAETIDGIRQNIKSLRNDEPVPVAVIEQAATALLERGGLEQIPVQIISLCQNMGLTVYMQELPKNICGYIAIDGALKEILHADKIISVNKTESAKRRRFTVAHELGHFLFNFDPARDIEFYNAFERDGETSPDEDVCNRFAAELLMPKERFRSEYNKTKEKYGGPNAYYDIVQQLSEEFLVPPKAVDLRIKKELRLAEE